jgi:hypothetical protein
VAWESYLFVVDDRGSKQVHTSRRAGFHIYTMHKPAMHVCIKVSGQLASTTQRQEARFVSCDTYVEFSIQINDRYWKLCTRPIAMFFQKAWAGGHTFTIMQL